MGRHRSVYYGRRVAGALALTETVSWSVLYYAVAVVLLLHREVRWSRTVVTGVFSLALLVSGMLLLGVGSVVFLPIFYGALGFVFGLLIALLYNLVARFVGAAEVEVEPRNAV